MRRVAAAVGFLLALAGGIDALWIEPYSIEVTHHRIAAPLAAPLKIAHVSDLHTHGFGRRERKLLELLESEKPDLIVITGDTIADNGTYAMCRDTLSHFHAPLGVWLVRGNWENWRPLKNENVFYAAVDVHFLLNAGRRLRDDVWLVGLDDASAGTPDLQAALRGVPPEAFRIALFHSPMFFRRMAGACPLALAGHTHGGQVRLPLLPPVWLPYGSGKFLEGWYEERGSRMYVSRGVGTSILPIRFRCRPELAIITLER